MTNWFVKVPLKAVLILPFVLQTVTAVALVGYFSYKNGQQAVEDLAKQLMREVSARIEERLDGYLQTPQQILAANHLAWQQGTLDITNLEEVKRQFWQQIKLQPSLSSIYFLNAGGEMVGYGRFVSEEVRQMASLVTGEDLPLGGFYFAEAKNPNFSQRKYFTTDAEGKPKKLIYSVKINFRTLPWYLQAKASKQQAWTPVIVYKAVPILGICAVDPVYDSADQLQGIFASDVALANISSFLNKLNFSPSGQAFIIDDLGNLVATSTLETIKVKHPNSQLTPLSVFHSKDVTTREIADFLKNKFGSLQDVPSGEHLHFISQGKEMFIRVVPYRDNYGLNWLIVVAVPASDFMAKIDENTLLTILLCVVTLVGTLGMGIFTTKLITQPILSLNAATKNLGSGYFTATSAVNHIKEIGELTDSFNQMSESLKTYFSELKQSEQKFATLLDAVPIGIIIFDKSGRLTMINSAGEMILGKELIPEISLTSISENYRVYIAGTDQIYLSEHLPGLRALKGEVAFADDIEVRRNDGKVILLEVRATPIFDETGKVIYSLGYFADITERKQAQKLLADYNRNLEIKVRERTEALQRSEAQINAFFTSASVGMAIVDKQLRFVKVNQTLAEIDGCDIQDMIGKSLGEVLGSFAEEIENLYLQVFRTGQPILNREVSGEVPSSPGFKRYWLVSYFPIFAGDNSVSAVGAVIVEISDRKQLELAVKASEAKLNDILNTAVAAITSMRVFADGNWELDHISTGCEPICGYTAAEIKADKDRWIRCIVPEDWQAIESQIYADIFAQRTGNYEYRIQHKDGSLRWISQTNSCRWDECHNCWMVTVISLDITERKQVKEALAQSESRLQKLAAASPGVIYTVVEYPEGPVCYEYLSPAFEEIHEVTIAEVCQNPVITFNQIPPDDRCGYQEAVANALANNQPFKHEWRIITPSGKIKWIQANSRFLRRENGEIVWHGIVLDVTDRKLAEEALRNSELNLRKAQKVAHIGSWEFDCQTRKTTWTEELYRIHGRDPAEPAPEYPDHIKYIHPDDRLVYQEAVATPALARKAFQADLRIIRPNGEIRYVEIRGEPILNEQGKLIKMIGTVMDITERKKVEAELSQAKETAEAANRAKSAFLANMSHELRTPLNAILGFAQLISQSDSLPEQHREHLAIINRSGEHLRTLIGDVLDMAKIEAGRITLHQTSFSLHRLLDDLEKLFALKAKEKKLQLIFERDASVPDGLLADEVKLRQILINLLGNGIKFTEAGRVVLRVKWLPEVTAIEDKKSSQSIPNKQRLFFEIEDTGLGIPEEELEKIFEPFLQTRTGNQSQEGTGLGLPISRKFIQIMGGQITVSSQVKVGSNFSFYIPVDLVEAASSNLNQGLQAVSVANSLEITSSSPEDSGLNAADFATLDPSLVERLEQATIQASWQEISRVIEEINAVNPDLAKELKELVQMFDYGEILKKIDTYKSLGYL